MRAGWVVCWTECHGQINTYGRRLLASQGHPWAVIHHHSMVVFEWTFGTTQNQSNGGAGARVEADNNHNATDKPWRQFIRNESKNTRDLHSFRMTYFCHVPPSTTPEATIWPVFSVCVLLIFPTYSSPWLALIISSSR